MSTNINQSDTSKNENEHSSSSSAQKTSSLQRTPSISSPLPLRPSATVTESNPPSTPAPSKGKGKGKRKADEVEGNTPPDSRKQKATFAADPRPHRGSGTSSSSHAPSSYTRKRARLSVPATSAGGSATTMGTVGETEAIPGSRAPSRSESQQTQNAGNTGTWNSTRSRQASNLLRAQSRTSHRSQNQSNRNPSIVPSARAPSRRGSISQGSIPISALISPHAPSLSHQHSSVFHMRDPRRPPKIQPTPWTLSLPQAGYFHSKLESLRLRHRSENVEEPKEESFGWLEGGGSPVQGFLFFIGFILFPLWWIASFLSIPPTRSIEGGHDGQKSVVLDDPQVEHDARSWRKRCRVMSAVSFVTYIPFIILVAIFA